MKKYVIKPSDKPESRKARIDFCDVESLKKCAQREHAKAMRDAFNIMFKEVPKPDKFRGMS